MFSKQQILSTRRTYNKLVANEMMEDFALRFTAKRARQWSLGWIANTALGIVSFLVLEAIGGAITLNFGFTNSLYAILAVVAVIFFSGIPISYYAAKYGVDVDLLSRGAGFGYIGSTIASLIYASFTFIFFALEAAIMSMALKILFGLPLAFGYVVSALIVLPLVTHGISYISRFQVWTQPIWLLFQIVPLFFVFTHPDSEVHEWFEFTGQAGEAGTGFDLLLFGAASAILLSLVAQIGEQVDFLRFLPEKPKDKKQQWQWWAALITAGPGWIIFGSLKLLLGSFLAYLALKQGIPQDLADDPAHMYQMAFGFVFDNKSVAVLVACCFVVLSQLKINVANAYAGSLAWSNFFSRVTHNHPGRVVWLFFNVGIALLLMELGIYQTIESMLSVYSVFVLAWLSSVVADLVINKPLGISPKHIEFKRAFLYDINPVGVGSMLIASIVGFTAHAGWYGVTIEALASFIAFGLPFITVPLIGYLTKGKYYLADSLAIKVVEPEACLICENEFDEEDLMVCPAYDKTICSLCCSLDVRCGDMCRPNATLSAQSHKFFTRFLSAKLLRFMTTPLMQFVSVTLTLSFVGAGILFLIYLQTPVEDAELKAVFASTLIKIFFLLLIIIGVVSWLFILARSSNRSALKELRSQAKALETEISAHERTSKKLQNAKNQAESANEAKSRYMAGLSHELRTPLNVLLGYAQLLTQAPDVNERHKKTLGIVKRNGEHLADLIEGLLEISKIEAGKLTLQRDIIRLPVLLNQMIDMFTMQAKQKGLKFTFLSNTQLPEYVQVDKQRLRQILLNLLSNAVKYTEQGEIKFIVTYRNQVVQFSVQDSGVGIAKEHQNLIFKPFEQIRNAHTQAIGGTGLGLTISRSLAELMGGEITINSALGQGSTFSLKLMLPRVNKHNPQPELNIERITGYVGKKLTILVVDDDASQRGLMADLLTPLGFEVLVAENAVQGKCLLSENKIDLVLLDVRMPDENGWQMAKWIRQSEFTMPVIMISANAREQQSDEQECGYHNDYMVKPINIDILLGMVGQHLNIHWVHQTPEDEETINDNQQSNEIPERLDKQLAGTSEYKALNALAEIGYLSGFNEKLAQIEQEFSFPKDVKSQITEYLELCNFPQINKYLSELINE